MAQTSSNGKDEAGVSSDRFVPPGYTVFRIGGKDIAVPPLTFWCLEARDEELKFKTASVREHTTSCLMIIATSLECEKAGEDADPTAEAIEKTFNRLKRRIIFGEMRQLGGKMDELLINSGYEYNSPGEAQAASPGTETLTDSPQTSQSEESAEAIPPGSSVN